MSDFTPICPDLLTVGCVSYSTEGSESTFCDGHASFGALNPTDCVALGQASNGVGASCSGSGTQDPNPESARGLPRRLQPAPGLPGKGHQRRDVGVYSTAPAVRRTRFGKASALVNNLIPIWRAKALHNACAGLDPEVTEWMAKRAADFTVRHAWQEGDVVVIDKRRVIHGNTLFSSGTRYFLVRMMVA